VLKEPAEMKLATHLVVLRDKLEPLFAAGSTRMRWSNWLSCVKPVDAFFDNVMVMAENEAVRINRLTL
jgi:glycyl-tRNA synthetase beta chain